MLQTLLDFLMYVGVLRIIIFVGTIVLVFEYLFRRVRLFNSGTMIGIGLGGFIGLIGLFWPRWDWISAIAACLLAGFISSGLYRRGEERRNRANEERLLDIFQRALEQ